ncbi:MAG: methionyl-tRNA formyltransferase [Flavobacteriales bacterium]
MNHRILFMGTPPFAVASLNALIQGGIDVAGVVTAPDRPAGRGQQVRRSAVKERALELQLPILQPEKLKDPAFHAELDALGASLYVVVAFRMLPEVVWQRPELGTINLHASLLPDYRGAAPINWAVMNGERRTGVTTFFLQHAIDTGDVLLREAVHIGPDDTAGELHDRLMEVGGTVLTHTVKNILDGTAIATPQDTLHVKHPHHAPKLTPEIARIQWDSPATAVHDHVRGLSPMPGAWTRLMLPDKPAQHFKVLRTRRADGLGGAAAGTIRIVDGRLLIACGEGAVEALEVQPEGKRAMEAAAFINGLRGTDGCRVE